MKKKLIVAIVVLLVVGIGYLVYNSNKDSQENCEQESNVPCENLGGGWYPSGTNMIGSSTNYQSVPFEAVKGNSTTTDATNAAGQLNDGGALLTQRIDTEGKDVVLLNISAVGGTVTSTLFIRQMGAHDESNYFDIASSTLDFAAAKNNYSVTSTVAAAPVRAIQWDPGTASTSVSIPFHTIGYRDTRFIVWSEDLATDPTDGVQVWITAIKIDPITR